MTLALSCAALLLSMLVIWRASDAFEDASRYLGRNLSAGVRGASINAIGSSLPEFLTVTIGLLMYANTDGFAIGLGTTTGSALFNAAVIPALTVVAIWKLGVTERGIPLQRNVVMRDGLYLIFCQLCLLGLIYLGELGSLAALALIGLYVIYALMLVLSVRKARKRDRSIENDDDDQDDHDDYSDAIDHNDDFDCSRLLALVTLDIRHALLGRSSLGTGSAWLLILAATSVIGAATWLLVESVIHIGEGLNIATLLVAVILAAAATSVPDTILSVRDAKKGDYDDALANALGSNIFDISLCIGLPVLLFNLIYGTPLLVDAASIGEATRGLILELQVLLIGFTLITFLLFIVGSNLTRAKAVALLVLYGLFVVYVAVRAYGL